MINDKNIVYDFDGVFVDDFNFHKKKIEEFLNIEITNEEFYKIHSGNVYKNDGAGLELENFDVQKYCQSIKEELKQLPIVDGMREVVENTQGIGKSFVVSSGCEDNIKGFFDEKEICENLCTIYGVETNPSKEKKFEKILKETGIDAKNTIFVTDTLGDILEANTLGIASIAVTWGFHRIETLQKGMPFGFAHSASDITKLIEQYFKDFC